MAAIGRKESRILACLGFFSGETSEDGTQMLTQYGPMEDKVLSQIPKEEFPAQTLTCELYLEAGIRACEIGYILADRDPVTRENRFGGLDFVRLCIPRRVYTNNHMDVIAAALKNVYDRREQITRGLKITKEAPLMRHFTVELERL